LKSHEDAITRLETKQAAIIKHNEAVEQKDNNELKN
jgi:hypothetical protein